MTNQFATTAALANNPPTPTPAVTPSPAAQHPALQQAEQSSSPFVPTEPQTFADTGLEPATLQGLILKLLANRATLTSRALSDTIQLPRPLIAEALEQLRVELLISIKGSAGLEDYYYKLTEAGHERADRLLKQCSYADVAPVPLDAYIDAMQKQSLQNSRLSFDDLKKAFNDLRLDDTLLSQLGQAINDGRGLFLYGPPGNGKTSVSEQVVNAFGELLWIPHTITIEGELVRLYDPRCHQAVESAELQEIKYDRRWILIHRPTIVVGGELSMAQLDLQFNAVTGICEAPVQMRANCGALVIDDFGRQRMPTSELLNRLIVPMEKHHDYLNLASGRQLSVPFDMLLVFSTNLEPSALVDEAFLRRIPYKIEVHSPTKAQFASLFSELARGQGCLCTDEAVDYLLQTHFERANRPLRYCHPRDLLRQIRNYCDFHGQPLVVSRETIDVAVQNYFAGL